MKIYKPKILRIELTNRCNAKCVMCWKEYMSRHSDDMDFSLYKKIIDSCPSLIQVRPQGFGEPLLYPHIVEAVAYASENGLRTVLYTNAGLLDKEMAVGLLKARLSSIVFSVDSCDKRIFELMRARLKWETILSNIERFQKLRNEGDYKTRTVIRPTITKESKPMMKETIMFWKKHVDVVHPVIETYVYSHDELLERRLVSGNPFSCSNQIKHLTVNSNGDVILCTKDYHSEYVVGNLYKSDVLEVYNCEEFNSIRRAISSGINYPNLCERCSFREGTDSRSERV